MNEPKRLLDSGPPHLRALVEAGKHDTPGAQTEMAVLCALGLGATAGAALGSGAVAYAASPSSFARALAGLRHVAFSKIGIGVIATAMAGSAGYMTGRAREQATQHTPMAESAAAQVAPSPRPEPIPPPTPATMAAPNPQSSPSAGRFGPLPSPSSVTVLPPLAPTTSSIPVTRNAPPLEATPGHASNPVVAPSSIARAPLELRSGPTSSEATLERPAKVADPSIAAQLESVRRARMFVRQGDGKAALSELDAYEAQSPHGTFEEEDIALRVQALRLVGDSAGAARELTELKARFPGSVHLAALAK